MNLYKFDPNIVGKGEFGCVRIATIRNRKNNNNNNKKFAIKTIPKKKFNMEIEKIHNEIKILKTLDHPNIVRFYEGYEDDKFIHLVLEYCDG